jgi:integrase
MASLLKRGSNFYVSYYVGGKELRKSLGTDNFQLAKEKQRQFESAQLRGDDNPLPTRTPIGNIITAYVNQIRTVKTAKSAQTDIYYLRDAFGPVCEAIQITSRKIGPASKKRPPKPGQDRRRRAHMISAQSFEQITTADISEFITGQVQSRGLAPKTANRYREILCRLFNWAMEQRAVRMPSGRNPAAAVERYKERAPEIRFLTLAQIDQQLNALAEKPKLQTMVAVLIYAGLRREELLWLTHDDIDRTTGTFGMIRVRAKTIDGESWQPKTKVNRAVPISSTLRHYLDTYRAPIVPGGWLFPSPDGKRWDPDNFSQDLRAVNTAANLPWGCLDYRHSFGSQLAMKGESLYKISALMGNSPEICRRHYAALLPESLADTVEFQALTQTRMLDRADGDTRTLSCG